MDVSAEVSMAPPLTVLIMIGWRKANEKDGPMRGEGSAYDELQAMKRSFMRRNQVRAGRRRGRTHDLVILCMGCTAYCELNVQVIQSGDGGAH